MAVFKMYILMVLSTLSSVFLSLSHTDLPAPMLYIGGDNRCLQPLSAGQLVSRTGPIM